MRAALISTLLLGACAIPIPFVVTNAPAPASPEAAVAVLRDYYADVDAGRWADAARHVAAEGMTAEALRARHAGWRIYRGDPTGPATTEGAAGSSYATVPVRRWGLLADGRRWDGTGEVVLRRVNDVPGASEAQLRWRITSGEPPAP